MKAAVLAAKENSNLPIFVTMTLTRMAGLSQGVCASYGMYFAGDGVDAVESTALLVQKRFTLLLQSCALQAYLLLSSQMRAFLIQQQGVQCGSDEFAEEMVRFSELGVQIVGGCCGTNPSYISELKKRFENIRRGSQNSQLVTSFCSSTNVVSLTSFALSGRA